MAETGDNQMARVIAKAWADEGFKAKLHAAPAETLRAEGVAVPEGVSFEVVEDTPTLHYLVLPSRPEHSEISEDALEGVAGGLVCRGYCFWTQ